MEENPIELSDRLYRALTDDDDTRTEARIEKIVNENGPAMQRLVDEMRDKRYIDSQIALMDSFDVDSAWQAVSAKTYGTIDAGIPVKHRLIIVRRIVGIAAMLMLIFAAARIIKSDDPHSTQPPMISEDIRNAMTRDTESGLTGAEIRRSSPDEDVIILPDTGNEVCPVNNPPDVVARKLLSATKVTTYYDKEYWLTLSDGSVVHLGRGSRLIYPDNFSGDSRDVYLEGEAYFIVAGDPDHKFVVHTPLANTTVYGTQFCVTARGTDSCSVVLVQGCLGITPAGGNEIIISPGSMGDIRDGEIMVSVVDTAPYEAWNTGYIRFDDWTLSRVMSVISRWYGKEVIFASDDCCDIEISGSFNRYDNLTSTIESIAVITGLTITASSDTITVQ